MTDRFEHRQAFIAALHGLRGIAVLYVVVSHLGNRQLPLLPVPLDAIGKVGVWIFFGLSAYLLTDKLVRALANRETRGPALLRYAIHRVFRIYPLFVVALLLHVACGDITWGSLGSHLILMEGYQELWAIPIEFQYYLVIPLVALAAVFDCRLCALALIVLFAAAMLVGVAQPRDVFSNGIVLLPKIVPFLLASLLALRPFRRWAGPMGLLSISGLIAGTLAYRQMATGTLPWHLAPWVALALGLSVAGIINALLRPGILARLLGSRGLVWLGEISFSLYLLHMFVISAILHMGFEGYVGGWVALVLAIVVASLSNLVIERPGIRAGQWISIRWIGARLQRSRS